LLSEATERRKDAYEALHPEMAPGLPDLPARRRAAFELRRLTMIKT
jgi:hypothetical protein